jgi:hypothetical protein
MSMIDYDRMAADLNARLSDRRHLAPRETA